LALRLGANAICEKPLVISTTHLDQLQELEIKHNRRIYTILQLREHPKLIQLREQVGGPSIQKHAITLTYVTSRGSWYDVSWKGSREKSGGITFNIGIHLFDLLLWLFGAYIDCRVYYSDTHRISGFLELEYARVTWFLSIDYTDLPSSVVTGGKTTYRSIIVDNSEIEFTDGFSSLHTEVYRKTLEGSGLGIQDARPSIELSSLISTMSISKMDNLAHPLLTRK
jgi:UDP-N-acetyl-2-amino-2-deoxyglucuronate dehydrogenase